MQFSSKEDIEAPVEQVFAMLSEFEAFERSAIRRGIDVQRVQNGIAQGVGVAWTAQFDMRGKRRNLQLELVQYDRPGTMRFAALSQGLDGTLTLDLVPLSQRRTRMGVILNLTPKTLPARLMLQSLKLAKSSLTNRFRSRVRTFARNLEHSGSGRRHG